MIMLMIKNLQKEMGIFLIAMVAAVILIGGSRIYWQTVLEEKQVADDQLMEAKEKYRTALDRKKLLKEFGDRYKQLVKSGIVGDEQRINWIDELEKSTRQKKIPYVKYKIDKQKTLKQPELAGAYPGIDVFQSTMILNMELLHEGDLYAVINHLQAKAKGLFDISQCTVHRNNRTATNVLETKTDKNFSARCQLNWFTIKQQSANALAYSNNENEDE